MQLTIVDERGYIGLPGLALPLPNGIIDPDNKQHPNTRFARFPGPKCTFFTKYKEIQDYIESTKYFKNNEIRRVPTLKERQEAEHKAKINQFIENKKQEIDTVGLSCLPNEATDYESLLKFAELVGLKRSGPRKSKDDVLAQVYEVLGQTYEKPKEKGK